MDVAVCQKFCSFYKPRKERMKCGTYAFLKRNLSTGELRSVADRTPRHVDFSEDREIREMVCAKCDFLTDGCDYREGLESPPCGGYTIVEHLLKKSHPLSPFSA